MEESQHTSPNASTGGYESSFERVSGRTRIGDILERLAAKRANIAVAVPGSSRHYASSLLTAARARQELILDELAPEDGHSALVQARKVRVIARLNGAILHFSSDVTAIGETNGIQFYRLRWPEVISYRQRRRSYRVPAERTFTISADLEDGRNCRTCSLYDISADGVGLCMSENDCAGLKRFDRFDTFSVRLPNGAPFQCAVEVRNVRCNTAEHQCIVGGRFIAKSNRDHELLARAVAAFERYAIRKKRNKKNRL